MEKVTLHSFDQIPRVGSFSCLKLSLHTNESRVITEGVVLPLSIHVHRSLAKTTKLCFHALMKRLLTKGLVTIRRELTTSAAIGTVATGNMEGDGIDAWGIADEDVHGSRDK